MKKDILRTSNREIYITSKCLIVIQIPMFIKKKKNTLYVNFNKRKREYIVIPIIPIVEVIKN